jgi:hypothetical protein
VKAFNTVFAHVLALGHPLDVLFAGDDAQAKASVSAFIESLGLRPLDVGSLEMAHWLEGAALLMMGLAGHGAGFNIALRRLRPPGPIQPRPQKIGAQPCLREALSDSLVASSQSLAFSSFAQILVKAAMSSSSSGSTKYFFIDSSKVRLTVSAYSRPVSVKLINETRPSPWSAPRRKWPASICSCTSRDARVGLTLTSCLARARTA